MVMYSPLEVAREAAHAAEVVIRQHYCSHLAVDFKADHTPVTLADREAERVIKNIIRHAFPDHGFYGEESGLDKADAEYLWLVDPIDGTKSFVRRYPFFSTQIALLHHGEIILGVSNAPLFEELAWAERGKGACLNGQPLHVSPIQELAQAVLSFGNIQSLVRDHTAGFARLVAACDRVRGYGDFYHSHRLADGSLDVVVESEVSILDVAALSLIIQEAGGQATDLNGASLNLNSRSFLATNGHLHAAVADCLFDR